MHCRAEEDRVPVTASCTKFERAARSSTLPRSISTHFVISTCDQYLDAMAALSITVTLRFRGCSCLSVPLAMDRRRSDAALSAPDVAILAADDPRVLRPTAVLEAVT